MKYEDWKEMHNAEQEQRGRKDSSEVDSRKLGDSSPHRRRPRRSRIHSCDDWTMRGLA